MMEEMMMGHRIEFAVRIIDYTLADGRRALNIAFNDENAARLNTEYIRLWSKGSRLYFIPSVRGKGMKLSDGWCARSQTEEIINATERWVGTYDEMQYDDMTNAYYVDAACARPNEREASRGGVTHTRQGSEVNAGKARSVHMVSDEEMQAAKVLEDKASNLLPSKHIEELFEVQVTFDRESEFTAWLEQAAKDGLKYKVTKAETKVVWEVA